MLEAKLSRKLCLCTVHVCWSIVVSFGCTVYTHCYELMVIGICISCDKFHVHKVHRLVVRNGCSPWLWNGQNMIPVKKYSLPCPSPPQLKFCHANACCLGNATANRWFSLSKNSPVACFRAWYWHLGAQTMHELWLKCSLWSHRKCVCQIKTESLGNAEWHESW